MKVVKPLKVPILTRVVEQLRKPQFHVTAVLGFPLDSPRALLDEMAFWTAAQKELGASILDEGITKNSGELLVAGRFFAPGARPVPASYVRVQAGNIDKRLAVIGDRHWQRGVPTQPKPIAEMSIDWAHAFGGKDFAKNPYGMGIATDGQQVQPLPNVERYGALIRSPNETPEPDCLLPLDMSFEQRRKRSGTFGFDYVEKYHPGLPPDHDPQVFNAAQPDQWIAGIWRGDERVVVENMSQKADRIEGALPGLTTRAFATHRSGDGERFVEIRLRCDTLWLFPSAGLGAVIFHGWMPIADDDAGDVAHLVVACEEPNAPRPLDHYQAALARRLDKEKSAIADLSDSDLMPARESGVAPNMDFGSFGQWVKSEQISIQNGRRGKQLQLEQLREKLKAEGIDPARYGLDQDLAPPEPPPPTDDLDAMATYIETAEQRMAEEEKKAKEKVEEAKAQMQVARAAAGIEDKPPPAEDPPGGPPQLSAEARLKQFAELAAATRKAGHPNVEIEQKLQSGAMAEELTRLEQMAMDGYRGAAHLLPAAAPMTAEASQIARVVIQAARDSGEPLAERDLTGGDFRGLDLSRMDFSRALLEGADLRGADLSGATFEGAVLAKADLRGARLAAANLRGANLGKANLEEANLDGADLEKAELMSARVKGALLSRVKLSSADLLEVDWSGVDLRGACLDQCTFLRANLKCAKLAGASLVNATLIECQLDEADFSEANLHKATFVTCKGERTQFTRARMNEAVLAHLDELPRADFTDALLEKCCLRTTVLRGASFARARMTMADLSECDAQKAAFDRAVMKSALLIRTTLEGASLRGVNLTEAILSKSKIAGADFTGAQLTRADFSRARGDDRTRFSDAVVKWTRFDKEGGRPAP